ncbi:unnamed protein product [Ectocarpus sp. CCAP 1310/34]|nr:unnamed protein product [Ectocarpus sp. CCAP 1310/34]
MAILTRWVGSAISTPKNDQGPASLIGRQRHYGALELAGTGEQVNVNDVVEITDTAIKVELEQPGAISKRRLRLAQVLSMWEDTFTGLFKFRARYLVYASDLPDDAVAGLVEARRKAEGTGTNGSMSDAKAPSTSNRSSPWSKGGQKAGCDEVLLTNKWEDLDVVLIVKPITLRVGAQDDLLAGWKYNFGPRLTLFFDASSGEFTPVERTETIAKRARIRFVETVARGSRRAEEVAAANSGQPATQSSGWLLPKRRAKGPAAAEGTAGRRGSIAAAASVGDTVSAREPSEGESSEGEDPMFDDLEWENDDQDSDYASDLNNSTDTRNHNALELPVRKSSRRKKSLGQEYDQDVDPSSEDKIQKSPSSPPLAVSAAAPPMHTTPLVPQRDVGQQGPLPKRPRRLAMPPVEGMPALNSRRSEEPLSSSSTTTAPKAGGPVKTRAATEAAPSSPTPSVSRCSAEAARDAGGATESKCRRSIGGTRTRGRSTKAAVDGADKPDCDPQQILVGDDYQADIPDLLSAEDRKKEAGHPAARTGAKMVWRSIRNWDPQSRHMLSTYLHAAKDVVKAKQASPGVAVHVRLGDAGSKNNGNVEAATTSVAGSYAVWAITVGCHSAGVIRVACSEIAQTKVPIPAIQRVQSEEQALGALVKARCTLDDFKPALKVFDQASMESVDPWKLSQVRNLKQALEEHFDPNPRSHGWAREGMDLEREDFIDLANVSKQVPGKTPTQVLSFFYRYLAAAKPLTDVVYGKEAAEARKLEAVLPPGASGFPEEASTAKLKPPASHVTVGPYTSGPAMRSRNIVRPNPPQTPHPVARVAPGSSASMTTRATAECRGVRPDDLKRYLSNVTKAALGGRAPAVAAYRAPASGSVSREYERQRAIRHQGAASGNTSADVEVLEVRKYHGATRGVGIAQGSQLVTGLGYTAARARQYGPEARSRQTRVLPSAGVTAPASDGYHTGTAVARPPGHAPQSSPAIQNTVQARRVRTRVGGRDLGSIVKNGGYPAYDEPSEVAMDEEVEFGFMAPCWRQLEMAHAFIDKDQLRYMKGLITTHVRKPMTRDQLLERADSCLQGQPEIFVAFVKTFDRISHVHAEAHLVPLYSGRKRSLSDSPPEPILMSRMSFNERIRPTTGQIDSRSRAPYVSYSRQHAANPTFAVPPGASVDEGVDRRGNGHGRAGGGGGPRSGPAHDRYPRVSAEDVDARRRWAVPATPGGSIGGWRHGASDRPLTYVSGDAGRPPPPDSSGPTGRPVMMYREEGGQQGFDVGREQVRAWPQHHHPNLWRAAGSPPEGRAPRPRMPTWVGNGRMSTR